MNWLKQQISKFPYLAVICEVSFYIVILLARINTPIQALLWQGFGIPSKKTKTEN